MAIRPLTVAMVAAGLLVVSVGADIAMNRSFALDVHDGENWTAIGRYDESEERYPIPRGPEPRLEVNRTDDVQFRLRVDHGYAWPFSDEYSILAGGRQVASGTLSAPARGTGEVTFTVEAETLLAPSSFKPGRAGKEPQFAHVEVRIDSTYFDGSFQIREVPR